MKKHLVFLTGAGMSAESGISTFRDSNGLWENHAIEDVATPEGFEKNPALVLKFYNARRKQLFEVEPNSGNTEVWHLHGELRKVRSTLHPDLIYKWEKDLNLGDKCEKGSQLRPHIVWFGEEVPLMDKAIGIVTSADVIVVIGTSLQVYPAAGLMDYARTGCSVFYIDPKPSIQSSGRVEVISKIASKGMKEFIENHLP